MAATDPRVEPATADDVDAVTDMWVALAAGQREYGATLRAEANRETVREWAAQSAVTGGLLVARDPESPGDSSDGTGLVGFVGFSLERGDYERDAVRGTVSNLFVVPERRGEGIGTALLDEAERALRERGADRVALEALDDNDHARAFYAERGYDRHRVELTKALGDESDAGNDGGNENADDATDESD